MKRIQYLASGLLIVVVGLFGFTDLKYEDKGVNIEVKGTSNLHDWKITSDQGIVEATVSMGANEKTVIIPKLNFSVASKSFKSGHSGMDKNVFKALQATDYPNITFELGSAANIPTDGNTYTIKAIGKLFIAGVTKQVDITVNCKWNAPDKSLTINGAKSFKMTEYNVKPPTALFGAIKTGDEITIDFYVKVTK